MKTSALLSLIALALWLYSATLQPYKTGNEASWYSAVQQGDSKAFHEARRAQLTPKYRLEDYAGTLLTLACAVAAYSFVAVRRAPKTNLGFALLAIAPPLALGAGFIYELILGYSRFEFPPWADSLGIPLMGVPVLLLIGLAWSAAHLALLRGKRLTGSPFTFSGLRAAGLWLKFVVGATVLLLVLVTTGGAYWYAVPGLLWLHFYMSLASTRAANGA
jgi:hypothetical protein